jgi:signal transduction histidine kinase
MPLSIKMFLKRIICNFVECDSEKAIITIEDNGIGIAEDKQGRVFECFIAPPNFHRFSGLGMYIVKET